METHYLYLLINIFTVAFPIAWSFEPNMHFVSKWKFVWPAILVVAVLLIIWDLYFVSIGVWGFSERYITGYFILGLPLEELLFFLSIPYASMFIYATLQHYKVQLPVPIATFFTILALAICVILGILNLDKLYPLVVFVLTSAILLYQLTLNRKASYMGYFWVAFFIIQVPFLVVDSMLTGSFTEEPIVWYNNAEILGPRLFTIPVEEIAYTVLLILGIVILYETFQKQNKPDRV